MSERAFSLIELLVGLAILGILLAVGASTYGRWLKNAQVRTAAEAVQNGLQIARAEAVRRNSLIRFQLTSTAGSDCALSTTATNWVVSYDDPTVAAPKCAAPLLNEAFPVTDATNNPAPRIIQLRPAAEGSRNVLAASDQMVVVFNGLGRVTPPPASNPIKIDLSNPDGGDCTKVRCLRVTVSAGGQTRMCDPAYPSTGTDPQRC